MKASSAARKILSKFPQDVVDYFLKLDKRCEKNRITLLLGSGKALNARGRCGGYFSEQERVLAVAIGGKIGDIISCVLHEECHMSQFLNKKSIWYKKGILTGHCRFFRYLDGDKIYKIKEAAFAAMELEADCERRAIKLAKKWPKYINMDRYIAKANSYILSYHWMLENRRWMKKSPYNRRIIIHSPIKLLRCYEKVPSKLSLAFNKYLR